MTLTVLKISHLEQLNSKIFALLSNIFSRLKIEHLIKQIGIRRRKSIGMVITSPQFQKV
ncbi:hypothetical protein L1285_15845 [Pseudoalteromonas sp. DL2-H2.2]|uniref:hypothetical protein n=1 Tax=Pseudoalteromonas sp. DL2-H2.2 TaxID=2908889 RepID=UPI001F177185|nr:hypothetical protein [Pseudoalteromonas sp. DL2-H2.2]MCF2909799.1 hypothetical protein [Pseudoalteromonas sp. DL2-H2.2]